MKNKLNIIMIFSYLTLLVLVGYFVHNIFFNYAIESNLEKSKQLRKEIMITRHYLSEIAPKVKITDENLSPFALTPAYVTSHITSEMSKNEKIYLKQTSLNYRNPKNAPDNFEKKILLEYKDKKLVGEHYELAKFRGRDSLRYTYPIYIEKQCLACHGRPYIDIKKDTYKLLLNTYGNVGFNYKLNDLRGMLSIAIDTKFINSTVHNLDKKIILIFILFILVIFLILYIEKRFIYKPQLDKIKKLNSTLAHKIEEEMEKNRKKEHILIEQSKLAQMGEMINMIAHQWRQPLNVISTQMIHLKLKQDLGDLTDKNITAISDTVSMKVQELSKIIDDFMKFNQPGSLQKFYLKEAILNVYEIVNKQLQGRGIVLDITNIDANLKVFHNQKAIEHILLNLIVNARDAFEEHPEIEQQKIQVVSDVDENGKISLNVIDNAGGIPQEIIHKIFNPYFTTKEEGKGTGIGLYMSKKMLEEVKGCKLKVIVKDDITIFSILFKV